MSFTAGDLIALAGLLITVLGLAAAGLIWLVRLQSEHNTLRGDFDDLCAERKADKAAYELRMQKAEEFGAELKTLNISVVGVADRFGREMLHLAEMVKVGQDHIKEQLANVQHEQRNHRMQLQGLSSARPTARSKTPAE